MFCLLISARRVQIMVGAAYSSRESCTFWQKLKLEKHAQRRNDRRHEV
jgi:hypothetical protein